MGIANRFNRPKKGQFGFDIADVFSYFGYFIAVLILIVILSIPSCLTGLNTNKADSNLQERTGAMALVAADAQLASYLRAQMPGKDELFAKLDWVEQHKKFFKTSVVDRVVTGTALPKDVELDVVQVRGFLDSHPDVYADKDYSEFISSLQAVYSAGGKDEQDAVKMAFKVVTAAMFVRAIIYPKKGDSYLYYLFPLSVDFQNRNSGKSGDDSDYDLSVGIMPTEMLPEREPLQSIQAIPLADSTIAKARLDYYPELLSGLPQP